MSPDWIKKVTQYSQSSIFRKYGVEKLTLVSYQNITEENDKYTGWLTFLGDKSKKVFEVKLEKNVVVFLREIK